MFCCNVDISQSSLKLLLYCYIFTLFCHSDTIYICLNKSWNAYFRCIIFTTWLLWEKTFEESLYFLLNFREHLEIGVETNETCANLLIFLKLNKKCATMSYPNVETNEKCRDFCWIVETILKFMLKRTKSAEISQYFRNWTKSAQYWHTQMWKLTKSAEISQHWPL